MARSHGRTSSFCRKPRLSLAERTAHSASDSHSRRKLVPCQSRSAATARKPRRQSDRDLVPEILVDIEPAHQHLLRVALVDRIELAPVLPLHVVEARPRAALT